jgi:microcystin-dependent protein
MATVSGTFSNRSQYSLRLTVNQGPQDYGSNQTTVYWSLDIIESPNWGSYTLSTPLTWTVWVDGQAWSGSTTYDFRNYDSLNLGSGSRVVTHNADGTKQIGFSSSAGGGTVIGSASNGGDMWLSTIPRASTSSFSGGASFDAGSAVTINTNRASSGFTHTITYSFGGDTGTIATGVGASTSWTPPLSLLNQIPNAASGTGYITTTTYSGGTPIGSKNTTFTLNAPSSVIPTWSGVSHAEANALVTSKVGSGKYVQGVSKITTTITGAAGVYGSSITQQKAVVAGQTVSGASGTTADPIAASGTVPITFSATDSRGRTKSQVVNVDVLPWAPPAPSAVQARRATSGGVVAEDTGTYIRVDLTAAAQSLINGTEKNTLQIKAYTRARGASTWTLRNTINHGSLTYDTSFVISGATFAADSSWEVRIEVIDAFAVTVSELAVPVASVLMHLGTSGVGFGKYHENGALDVGGDIHSTDEIFHRGGGIVQPAGMVTQYAGATAPAGWLLCDGSAVSRTTYAALFAALGTSYGAGNGSTTFNVPNLKGRVPVGLDSSQTEFDTRGESGGAKTHTHFEGTLRAAIGAVSNDAGSIGYQAANPQPDGRGPYSTGAYSITGSPKGGNNSFNHYTPVYGTTSGGDSLQPYLVMNYIIKT